MSASDKPYATLTFVGEIAFRHRLVAIRKQRGITQQALADLTGLNVVQIRRYETTPPSPRSRRSRRSRSPSTSPATSFSSTKACGPKRSTLRDRLRVLDIFDEDGVKAIESILDDILLKHAARPYAATG